ncbi:MAG: Lrp/AsnC family transcriptional regulator [Candidatus Thorarchaeota archaeon]
MGSTEKIDGNDRKIIAMLSENARCSLRDIASIVKLSPSSIRNRMERLVDLRVIKKYTLEVDYRKMGYEIQVIVLITARPGSSEELYKTLSGYEKITKVFWTSGPANFICIVRVEDMKALSYFMTGTLEKLEGIERIESMFLMPEPE